MPGPVWLCCSLVLAILGGTDEPQSSQNLDVVLVAHPATLTLNAVEVVAIAEDEGIVAVPISESDGQFRFRLSTEQTWRVTCLGDTFWCPRIEVSVPHTEDGLPRRIELPVARSVRLHSKIETAAGDVPTHVTIQGWELRRPKGERLSFEIKAGVDDGEVTWVVPAVLLDLRLAAEGFSPSYLWDLDVDVLPKTVEGRRSIGSVLLRPGSSLCGFIVDGESGDPVEHAEVRLRRPPLLAGTSTQTVKRLTRQVWSARSNGRGFFQLTGPPPGTYRLEVMSPDPKRPPHIIEAVELVAQAETCLEDLVLERAFEVSFAFDPSRAPGGDIWQVRLDPQRDSGFAEASAAESYAAEGRWLYHVTAGDYSLRVYSADPAFRVLRRRFRLNGAQHYDVSLEIIRVEGDVRLGDVPLLAGLRLTGDQGAIVTLESDPEGEFEGWMGEPGPSGVMVHVEAFDPPFSRFIHVEEVEINEGVLRLDLHFPNRVLTGSVHDEEGTPIRRAQVSAQPASSWVAASTTTTGADGRFELVGLDDVAYGVVASARGLGDSRRQRVDPWGEGRHPEVHLILQKGRALLGRLLSADREPIAGARLNFIIPGAHPRLVHDSTDVEGRFEVLIPETALQTLVQVFSPSALNWSACVPLPQGDAPLDLQLPSMSGGRVRVQPGEVEKDVFAQTVLVNSEGGLMSLSSLASYGSVSVDGGLDHDRPPSEHVITVSALAPSSYIALQSSNSLVELAALACAGALPTGDGKPLLAGQDLTLEARSMGPGQPFFR